MGSIFASTPSLDIICAQKDHDKPPRGDRERPAAKLQQTTPKRSQISSPHEQKAEKRPLLKIRWDRDYAIAKELHQSLRRAKELSRQVVEIKPFLDKDVFEEYWQQYLNVGIIVMCFRGRYGRYCRLEKWKRREGRLRSRK
jgi:hypothetical protein